VIHVAYKRGFFHSRACKPLHVAHACDFNSSTYKSLIFYNFLTKINTFINELESLWLKCWTHHIVNEGSSLGICYTFSHVKRLTSRQRSTRTFLALAINTFPCVFPTTTYFRNFRNITDLQLALYSHNITANISVRRSA
jgi:hypothetical protein